MTDAATHPEGAWMMTLHHRPHTLADRARFECVCGWHAESTDPDTVDGEFFAHLRNVGYEFAAPPTQKEHG